eukprot:TRINITY_DN98561_c0_g1_i1.p1 TRINITY_DN98561_c0_g1~~TRINITY_DN98561_c0_g1_i1.p1  ORF type:complete len:248 (+),score=47.27 TRINITY_DN98561_c0_g1_i1:94-837(+)
MEVVMAPPRSGRPAKRRSIYVPPRIAGVSPVSNAAAGARAAAKMYEAATRATSLEAGDGARHHFQPASRWSPPVTVTLAGPANLGARASPAIALAAPVPKVPAAQPRPGLRVRPKPSAAEQRRVCDRLSKGRCGDPRHTALMRRLNESASWLSEVSGVSDDEEDDSFHGGTDGYLGDRGAFEEPPRRPLPHGGPDARNLCLAEVLNESVTWLDTESVIASDEEDFGLTGGPPESLTCRAGIERSHTI